MKKYFVCCIGFKTIFICLFSLPFLTGCQPGSNNTSSLPTSEPQEKTEPETWVQQNTGSNELQVFIDELADRRLFKFSRYNSGTGGGGGMQSETWIDLCSNGRYFVYATSSISIGGTTTQDNRNGEGTWEVIGSVTAPFLKMTAGNGESGSIPIRLEGTNLYLNGERMYHVPKGDPNGPQSCN